MPEFPVLLSAFVTLLVTIGPFEAAPIFGALTRHMSAADRRRIGRRAVVIAGIVLVGFAIGGERLLSLLHVSLPALRTAGGVLLFLEAIQLVLARPGMSSITEREREEAQHPRDISVFPLAIPLLAGPGSMVAILLLVSQVDSQPVFAAGILLMLLLCLLITYAAFLLVDLLGRVLGVTGADVVGRVSGLLLAAMAMQFIFDGINQGLLLSPRP